MSIKTPFHPNITTGSFENFGYHKLKRQVKTAIVNMLQDFFDKKNVMYGLEIPELSALENKPGAKKIFIERDFPYTERKFPLIVPVITNLKERKSYLGFDNYLYTEVKEIDNTKTAYEIHAGMADIAISLIIASESSDIRDTLSEFVFQCFSNYYRGNYIYKDDEGSMFSIVPSTREILQGAENEIAAEDNTVIIYTTSIDIQTFVEYHFRAFHMGKAFKVDNFNLDGEVEER